MIEWLKGLFRPKPNFVEPWDKAASDSETNTPPQPPSQPQKAKADAKRTEEERAILSGNSVTGLRAQTLDFSHEKKPITLPPDLHCYQLKLANSSVTSLPEDLRVEFKIDLGHCGITALPTGLKTGSLILNDCRGLDSLPEYLDVNFLNIEGCVNLDTWPETARVTVGSINARGCVRLRALPASLGPVTNLDLNGCSQLDHLPEGLQVGGWIDIGGTKIQGLPESLQDVRLRWRGVMISARIAFFPETLTAAEILAERNAEVRRVMIERHGLDNFVRGANATVLDEDSDPGGKRQLLRIPMAGDEDLVCVSVHCPSTGRHYIVRVPPTTKTCREGVAWTAGYDKAADYNPIVET